jgi:hypothetical protein
MSEEHHRLLTRAFGPGVEEQIENSLQLVIVPAITLPVGCVPQKAFAIYVASPTGGYSSRLFFERPIRLKSGVEPRTTMLVLLGRTMYAASIQGVPNELPAHQAILAHLKRYEQAA